MNRLLDGSGASSGGAGSSFGGTDIDALARRVIAGEFGNGAARKAALGSDYEAVQKRVNELLGSGGASGGSGSGDSASSDIDALARAVIRGDFGNGEERRRRLGARYESVQRRVNQLLS